MPTPPSARAPRQAAFLSLIDDFSDGLSGRPVSEVLSAILHESGYEAMLRTEGSQERLDNLAELKQSVYDYETTCGEEATLEDYLSHVALFTNADAAEPGDKVKLMTVHAAKGLEFPYVFLCGLNEGIFPSKKVRTPPGHGGGAAALFRGADPGGEGALPLRGRRAELRRLAPATPPGFLLDIDPALLTFSEPLPDELVREARDYIAASSLKEGAQQAALAPGQRGAPCHFRHRDGAGGGLHPERPRGTV